MRITTVYWSPETDNTTINFNDDFVNAPRIVRLDVLKDLMLMFNEIYHDVLRDRENSNLDKKHKRYK